MAYWYVRTQPASEPFELVYVKTYLGVTVSTDDDVINHLIKAARLWAERYLGVALIETEIQEYRDGFPRGERWLDFAVGYVASLTAMTYQNADGGTVNFMTEMTGLYNFNSTYDQNPSRLWLTDETVDWPTPRAVPNCVSMIYRCGRGSDDIDTRIKQAMLLMISYWYRNKGDMAVGSTTFPELRSAQRILDQVPRVRI